MKKGWNIFYYYIHEYIYISNSNTISNILQYHTNTKVDDVCIIKNGQIMIGKLGLSFQFGARNAQQGTNWKP